MTTYMIGYDLNKPLQNYAGLIEAIKTYSPWWHHLDSTWLIVTDETAVQIRDKLVPYLDSNDELLVAKVSAPGAWQGFNQQGSEWLRDNLKPCN
ncbi:MAG TPA: SinR family protein [Clostridia bacterium]|nr:SinR family protein [Clostridia bacterium]